MTPTERQDLQRDVEEAHKLLERAFSREIGEREVAERFTRLDRRLCRASLRRIENGTPWSKIDTRSLRAIQRSGHRYAALLAITADVDLTVCESLIRDIACDDDRLTDELSSVRIASAKLDQSGGTNATGIDGESICICFAAASIRARVELHSRNGGDDLDDPKHKMPIH